MPGLVDIVPNCNLRSLNTMIGGKLLYVSLLLLIRHCVSQSTEEGVRPTPSPDSIFIAKPSNVTVLEGHQAILRCKINADLHTCQWFYLEKELDMFDTRNIPKLVKQFRPSKSRDCSIKFSKVKLIQDGQWLCKGLRRDQGKYVISEPAFLEVLRSSNDSAVPNGPVGTTPLPDEASRHDKGDTAEFAFNVTEDSHLVNTRQGEEALLRCQANKALESCIWIRPDGTKLPLFADLHGAYAIQGNLSDGKCSLLILRVDPFDEGNWRCVVSSSGNGDRLGPLIHLHVLELGPHSDGGPHGHHTDDLGSSSLMAILVATSLILLAVIIVLVVIMCRRRRLWNSNHTHNYLESERGTGSDYGAYGSNWLPGISSKEQALMDDNKSLGQASGHCGTKYLDMTGNSGGHEGYVMFPSSSAHHSSTMSSGTTMSTNPAGSSSLSRGEISDQSATSTSESMKADPTMERERPSSLYSESHLYEEIPDRKITSRDDNAGEPLDAHGYLIPSSISSLDKLSDSPRRSSTPELSKLATNPTYSLKEELQPLQLADESYDAPPVPPVPIRTDSANNPLSAYDVPSSSLKQLNYT